MELFWISSYFFMIIFVYRCNWCLDAGFESTEILFLVDEARLWLREVFANFQQNILVGDVGWINPH